MYYGAFAGAGPSLSSCSKIIQFYMGPCKARLALNGQFHFCVAQYVKVCATKLIFIVVY